MAVVGASDDPSKTASRPLRYLRQGGFAGEVYPIARRDTVMGERAWPSLDALPARPDHAFVLLPTDAAIEAVADCVRLGIPAVTVLASGFSESGLDGAAREARLRDLLRGSATRMIGPSSLGLANLHRRVVLTANAAFAEPDLPRGGLFVASQSGSMIGALASRGKARGIGFACLVSVGGEADLGVGELCEAALDDPEVSGFLLFLETIRDAPAIARFAHGAARRGKPVLAYKLGRSQAGAELAISHTGALAGEDDLADTFLRDCGIARVDTFEALLEAPALLRRLPIRRSGSHRPTVAVVTTTGGGAAMVVDQLGIRGVEVSGPTGEAALRLAAGGIDPGHGRILDLTLAGTRYETMKAALDALLADPGHDLVVAVAGSSARFQPDLAVRPVIDAAHGNARLAAFLVPDAPDALAMLAAADIPAFRTPESCADAIAAAFARRPPRDIAIRLPGEARGTALDEYAGYAILDALGIARAASVVVEIDAPPPALPFAYPVVAKALHPDLAHKTDAGGVELGIADAAGLAGALRRIAASVARHRPGIALRHALVQPMARGAGEVLIGYRVDRQVGPVVMLAAGGILAEIRRDRSVRLAPVDEATAHAMISEVRSLAALTGYRGRPRADFDALARAIVALSRAADDHAILELEINPLMVMADGHGVLAVDVLAVRA